jgi:hypothetical protein
MSSKNTKASLDEVSNEALVASCLIPNEHQYPISLLRGHMILYILIHTVKSCKVNSSWVFVIDCALLQSAVSFYFIKVRYNDSTKTDLLYAQSGNAIPKRNADKTKKCRIINLPCQELHVGESESRSHSTQYTYPLAHWRDEVHPEP